MQVEFWRKLNLLLQIWHICPVCQILTAYQYHGMQRKALVNTVLLFEKSWTVCFRCPGCPCFWRSKLLQGGIISVPRESQSNWRENYLTFTTDCHFWEFFWFLETPTSCQHKLHLLFKCQKISRTFWCFWYNCLITCIPCEQNSRNWGSAMFVCATIEEQTHYHLSSVSLDVPSNKIWFFWNKYVVSLLFMGATKPLPRYW